MSWATDLPSALTCQPLGFVVLAGLDITYNAVHKVILDCFCNNKRPDRVRLNYSVLSADHEYPKAKAKRTSYEWYIPKGIMRTNWMQKHLSQVPAVVVVFFDLDWDEASWKEKESECATRVEIVRSSLQGRSTKVAVVLIQKSSPLPPGEDVLAAERANSLCAACGLSTKGLFVLPHNEHLLGYVIRLENAFYELSQSYYHAEARKVKAHKEFLNKTTHQFLFLRHQFKIAFYNELKHDSHTAIKNYRQAYEYVQELRINDTNMLEIKTVAAFINYKICRLAFMHNQPLDAIAQIRRHIEFFKNRRGVPDLEFEHCAWLSKQFQIFGELFDAAIQSGLAAIQTQHPGFYFQQAADYGRERKHLCEKLCKVLPTVPSPDPLADLNNLDFYGQRPWRQGHQSIDPPDMEMEKLGYQCLQSLESAVDHSWIIIPLLSSAIAQFKHYRSPRMKNYLMVQMGEEYHCAQDHTKALTLLSRVTAVYRQERWWALLASIIPMALRCSYLVADVTEYVRLCLELLAAHIDRPHDEKTRAQMNLDRVVRGVVPEPEIGAQDKSELWSISLKQIDPPEVLSMHSLSAFVECKVKFTADVYRAHEALTLNVLLRASCPFPIRFSLLQVHFNEEEYDSWCCLRNGVSDEGGSASQLGDIYLEPNKTWQHCFSFLPQANHVSLEVTEVSLTFGNGSFILSWPKGEPVDVSNSRHPAAVIKKEKILHTPLHLQPWALVDVVNACRILPREPDLEVEVEARPPCLVGEQFPVSIHVHNTEKVDIKIVGLKTKLQFQNKPQNDSIPAVLTVSQTIDSDHHLCLNSGDKASVALPVIIKLRLVYKVSLEISGGNRVFECSKEAEYSLNVINPFDHRETVYNKQFQSLDSVFTGVEFLISVQLTNISTCTLQLDSCSIKSNDSLRLSSETENLTPATLEAGDGFCDCWFGLIPYEDESQSLQCTVCLGELIVRWHRKSSENTECVETSIQLADIAVKTIPLLFEIVVQECPTIYSCLPLKYAITNLTALPKELRIGVDSSEHFAASGHREIILKLLPNSTEYANFQMVPVECGNIPLPRLRVSVISTLPDGTQSETPYAAIDKMLPRCLSVSPNCKARVSPSGDDFVCE